MNYKILIILTAIVVLSVVDFVVYDGNGSIDCNKMRQQYQFPDEILRPEFCD